MTSSNIPEDIFYFFARKKQPVDELIKTLYKNPDATTISHFKAINDQLANDHVLPGQLIIVTPPNSTQCSIYEAQLSLAAEHVNKKIASLTAEEARILAEHYQLLNHITNYGSAGYGASMVYFNHHIKNIEAILNEINNLYARTYNSNGKLNSPTFYANRRALLLRLDNTLKTFIGHARLGFNIEPTNIKNSLGLSTKSIVHQWKSQPGPVTDIPGFTRNFDKVTKSTKLLKRAGYVGIALDGANSVVNIHQACTIGTDKECARTSFREGGRLSGSIIGGAMAGIATTYLTCNVLFGIESAGTSLLWCGIVAGAAGGYFGGKGGAEFGSYTGELIYETTREC